MAGGRALAPEEPTSRCAQDQRYPRASVHLARIIWAGWKASQGKDAAPAEEQRASGRLHFRLFVVATLRLRCALRYADVRGLTSLRRNMASLSVGQAELC